jgi:hypothetical protein
MRHGSYARKFLDELDAPATSLRPAYQQLQESFIAAMEPLVDLIMAARGQTAGESAFAVRQLLVRSLNDVVAAFHLLVHGYVNQGYSTMRMAYEATDIIELVATDTEQGALWVNSQKPWRDFRPGAVRKRLGKPEFDEFYDHLCAMSHPRFTAAHVTGYRVAPREEEAAVPELVLRLGPFVIDGHPAVPLALGLLNSVLGLVVLRTSHLAIAGAVTERDWTEALERSMAGQQRFVETLASVLARAGIDGGETIIDLYVNRPRL